MGKIAYMRSSGLPLCEPEQICEACSAQGTVGRAMRTNQAGFATETHRFCAACWAEHSARYRARWQEENRLAAEAWHRDSSLNEAPSMGTSFESATWHTALWFVKQVNLALRPSPPPTAAELAAIAAELEMAAAQNVGEIPLEIAAFIQQHRAPAR